MAEKTAYNLAKIVQIKKPLIVNGLFWRPQGDSNPRYRRESLVEWTSIDSGRQFKILFLLNSVYTRFLTYGTVRERNADTMQTRKRALKWQERTGQICLITGRRV